MLKKLILATVLLGFVFLVVAMNQAAQPSNLVSPSSAWNVNRKG